MSFDNLLSKLAPTPADQSQGSAVLRDMLASSGRPEDMTSTQISLVRDHLNTHFWDFAYLIGGVDILYAPLHGPVCDLIERWGTPGWKRIMVQLPRGALKSTLCTRTGALWRICRDPNTTVVIFNEKIERVERWLIAIQSIVSSNPYFRVLYRDLIPPGIAQGDPRSRPRDWKWSAREMTFVRSKPGIPEASITALSVGGASAGGHWEWIFHDDLISNEAQQSQTVMQSVKDWFDTTVYLGPNPESMNAFISCTRWHYNDVYEYARSHHGYRLYRRSAWENGHSAWPRGATHPSMGWTDEYLMGEMNHPQASKRLSFWSQQMNQPMAGEDTAFSSAWVREFDLATYDGEPYLRIKEDHYDPQISELDRDVEMRPEDGPPREVPLSLLNWVLLVDPAPTADTERKAEPNARTAMVLKAIDPWGRRFWFHIWAGRLEPLHEIRKMFELLDSRSAYRLAVEEVNFSRLYRPFINYICQREKRMTPSFIPLKPRGREKGARIRQLATSFQNGLEYVYTPCVPTLLEELVPYPYGSTVDILDAAAYDRDPGVLPRLEAPVERLLRIDRAYADQYDSGRDEVIGY